jgi:manganese transport protein
MKLKILSWLIASVIIFLNIRMIIGQFMTHSFSPWIENLMIAIFLGAGVLLLFIAIAPLISRSYTRRHEATMHVDLSHVEPRTGEKFKKIAIAVDFSAADVGALSEALTQGGKDAEYVLIHVVESAGAFVMGKDIQDMEAGMDRKNLENYVAYLEKKGYRAIFKMGFGKPAGNIARIVSEQGADLLIMGSHGHKGLKDLVFGTTINVVRHKIRIPVIVVKQ